MKRFTFAAVAGLALILAAATPTPAQQPVIAPSGPIVTPGVIGGAPSNGFTAPARTPRRGLFGRIRGNRGNTTVPNPVYAPSQFPSGGVVPMPSPGTGTITPVPTPMPPLAPAPRSSTPGGIQSAVVPGSVIVPASGTTMMSGMIVPAGYTYVPGTGLIPMGSTVPGMVSSSGVTMMPGAMMTSGSRTMTSSTPVRRGLFGRVRNR